MADTSENTEYVFNLNQQVILSIFLAVVFLGNGILIYLESDFSAFAIFRIFLWLALGFAYAISAFFGINTRASLTPKIVVSNEQLSIKRRFWSKTQLISVSSIQAIQFAKYSMTVFGNDGSKVMLHAESRTISRIKVFLKDLKIFENQKIAVG